MVPRFNFMSAKNGDEDVFNRKTLSGFIFEPKFDGVRVMIYKDTDNLEIINEKGEDIIRKYPEFLDISNNIKAQTCVLDAQIVVPDKDGKSNLSSLQLREMLTFPKSINLQSKANPAVLFVFDILFKDGMNFASNLSLEKRKEELKNTVVESNFIKQCPFTMDGQELWKKIDSLGIGGVMAKDLAGKYEEGKKNWSWLKINKKNTMNAIIVGFTKKESSGTDKKERYFDSLVLASKFNNNLVYLGTLKNIDGDSSRHITRIIKKLKTKETPMSEIEKMKINDNVFWIKPETIVEIEFERDEKNANKIKDMLFLRLRFDQKLEDIKIDY